MTNYVAKTPDSNGYIHYTAEEDAVWKVLYDRQIKIIENRACDAFMDGLEQLGLNADKIPQCKEISKQLKNTTGWSVTPVPALISFKEFFELLSAKRFPAASFIRIREELDYLKEPDIFHEIFGHTPLLTHPDFAAFTKAIGDLGVKASKEDRRMLARLYWFTTEFGLINTAKGLRIYGAGILSSKGETIYALESSIPNRQPFHLMNLLRTPYRYDEKQLNYFVIDDFQMLFEMITEALFDRFSEARELGMFDNPHDEPNIDQRSC